MPGWLVYLPLAFSRSPSFGPWPGFLATPRSLPQTDLPLHPAFPSMPATQPLSFPVVSVIWERQDKWSLFAGERLSVINKENQDLARACVCTPARWKAAFFRGSGWDTRGPEEAAPVHRGKRGQKLSELMTYQPSTSCLRPGLQSDCLGHLCLNHGEGSVLKVSIHYLLQCSFALKSDFSRPLVSFTFFFWMIFCLNCLQVGTDSACGWAMGSSKFLPCLASCTAPCVITPVALTPFLPLPPRGLPSQPVPFIPSSLWSTDLGERGEEGGSVALSDWGICL